MLRRPSVTSKRHILHTNQKGMLADQTDHNSIGPGAISTDGLLPAVPGERRYPTACTHLQASDHRERNGHGDEHPPF
jgi:hypothetical protein